MTEPNWAELWRELTARVRHPEDRAPSERSRQREEGAARYEAAVTRKATERADTLLDFVTAQLRSHDTVLDIGAGTGRFALPFARIARTVTAVEPSQSMAAVLRGKVQAEGLTNVHLVDASWEDAAVEPHDIAFCSHAMYSSLDLAGFVRKMESNARESCFLIMRVPSHDGVMRELSQHVHGLPYDSPNFWVGYHVLYDMGIYAHVVMEPFVRYWTDDSLDDALNRARRHLRLEEDTTHDDAIRETLARRLSFRDGQYCWPDGMRSALMWWKPSR